jgi:hypothetical protein
VTVLTGFTLVGLRDQIALFVITVGVDARKGTDTPGGRPGAGTLAIRDGNTLTALDERKNLLSGDDETIKRFQLGLPYKGMARNDYRAEDNSSLRLFTGRKGSAKDK